ncbi:Response regulator of zinc sigma-54-dependent two-component system [hydrothermal vent metagenome]|uniref:Response regulator of zinc sigma-54-dependent two-component system n=1 Tax=hydrothermal vent metagenome TaxID=652676 RepID=A0A3B1BZR7_9ZZZZ
MSTQTEILFVDDDPRSGELMRRFSEGANFSCKVFSDPVPTLEYFKVHGAALIVSDLRMPSMSGLELLQAIRRINQDIPFIIITGYANVEDAIEAMHLGASDFIKKPFDMDELQILIDKTLGYRALLKENQQLKRQLDAQQPQFGMIGQAPELQAIRDIVSKISDIRCNIIIEGESGTGKELVARAIHFQSQFVDQPFVIIDCGALTDTLLESELFGHEKGAFTGAHQNKTGLLEAANGGTVFLDEISNISDNMQMKLMRVIQEQQITRVGGTRLIDIDVRFIVASNRQLEQLVHDKNFRHDLYHRLNVVKIIVPPLRERGEDIPELVTYFIHKLAHQYQRKVSGFDAASMKLLLDYHWPGNIRELGNVIERHLVLADTPLMHIEHLSTLNQTEGIDHDLPRLDQLEQRYILKVLKECHDNREQTARVLGINKSTLWRKLQSYDKTDSLNE